MIGKEIARDILALGSIPFYLIVMARAFIGPFWEFLGQLLIAVFVLLALSYFIDAHMHIARGLYLARYAHMHIARGMILAMVVSMYYKDVPFTFFAFLLFGAMLISARILKIKTKIVRNAIIIGAISAVIALGTTW